MNGSRLRRSGLAMIFGLVMLTLSPRPVHAATHDITVGDNFFSPANVTIQVGDTVRWNNAAGGNSHNVTANNGSFASQTSSSFTFSHTFNSAGSVDYRCTIHASQMRGTITIQGGGGQAADLSLQTVSAEAGTFAPGDNIAIDISIKNVGGQASPAASITYYASTNSNISGSDIELGSDPLGALAANETLDYTANASFPNNIADGDYYIGAIIEINDASAGNNTAVDNGTITIASEVPEADLAVQSIDAPSGSFEQGESFLVNSTVQNIGTLDSGPYTLTFYASGNSQITTQDTVIGSVDRQGLAQGAEDSTAEQVTLPETLTPGSYYIGAIIEIDDSDHSNDSGVDGEPIEVIEAAPGFLINEGLNDAWFNMSTPGQGFFITVFPDLQKMFLAWFTFDIDRPPANIEAILGDPGHRWLTAFGPYAGDTAMLDVELTQGGVFDSADPAVAQGADGTIEVIFSACNAGVVNYDITSAALSGQVPIERIALDNVPLCEAQAAAK